MNLKRNFCARNNCFWIHQHMLEVICVNECSPGNMKSEIIKEPSCVLRKHDFSQLPLQYHATVFLCINYVTSTKKSA